jgi:DNA-binding response OmpR family regulator
MVIDGSGQTRDETAAFLEREGFSVIGVPDGETAVHDVENVEPIAVLLGLDLPGMDGFETCRLLRSKTTANLIVLTDRTDEMSKIVSFATGADDFLTKPVPSWEIAARLRAVARRRNAQSSSERMKVGPLTVDALARTATVDGQPIDVTRIEFDILVALARRPGTTLRRAELFEAAWGEGWVGSQHLLQVHLSNLRRKLAKAGAHSLLHTVRNVGYRLGPARVI